MRQLLGRKSNQKMIDRFEGKIKRVDIAEPHNAIWPPNDTSGPSHNTDAKATTRLNDNPDQPKVSERSQYIPSKPGLPPKVLSGTSSNTQGLVYRRCEDEPIHAPGTIQNFGALLGLKYDDNGNLEVRIASENSRSILGYGPEQLFALPSFLDVLQHDTRQEMVEHINHIFRNPDGMQEETQLEVFQFAIGFPFEPDITVWVAMHLAPGTQGLLICEFEEYSDSFFTKDVQAARKLPAISPLISSNDIPSEDYKRSTISKSKPLPVLELAQKREDPQFSSTDIFKALIQAQRQISACTSLSSLYDVVVGIVAELTCFHRVMLYRFDSEMNGFVESELLDPRVSDEFFRGMHFPASDIPKQAQALYKVNRIRLLHDRAAVTARLVCRNKADFAQPLDLTHSYLRSISPIHCKYLANMGVRSTMSISIVIDGKLWGLIACHGYGDAGIRVSLPIRELCRQIGECAASAIQQLLMAQRIAARAIPITNTSALSPATFASSSADLLRLVDADFAVLVSDDNTRTIGMLDPFEEALAIISYLQSCQFTTVQSSNNINEDFPGLSYAPGLSVIGGLLFIPLKGHHFLVFFRKTQIKKVRWAGNPYNKKLKAGSEYLQPRNSFKKWEETIANKSREWTADQMDTASVLSTVYSKMTEMWRGKDLTSDTAQMVSIRSLTQEFETPLNALIICLEMASQNPLDEKTRTLLNKAYEASNSLLDKSDSLSELIGANRDAHNEVSGGTFDLRLTATSALQVLQKEAKRSALEFAVSVHERLPGSVKGSSEKFKQLIVYLTQSAFKRSSSVHFNMFLLRSHAETSTVIIQVQDNGSGMSEHELNMTIEELERGNEDNNRSLHNTDAMLGLDEMDGTSGVDITTIGQYTRSLGGKVQVTSEPGTGTIFTLELPFKHPASDRSTEKPRKLRNIFLPASRPSKSLPFITAPTPPLQSHNPVHQLSKIPPAASFSLPQDPAQQYHHRQPSSPPSPEESPKPIRRSKTTPSESPSPTMESANPIHRSSKGTSSARLSPPLDSALPPIPVRRDTRRRGDPSTNKTQAFWETPERANSLSPPPDRALPPRPIQHSHALNMSQLGISPPATIHENMDQEADALSFSSLNILIADDDSLILRTLKERLSQWGHSVTTANDGQECHDRFEIVVDKIDVILMDLRMPGVDGTLSTRMIRFLEKEQAQSQRFNSLSSSNGSFNGKSKQRVPIFALSASLYEDKRFDYLQAGFDGWILKPIDFHRLDVILQGVKEQKCRKEALYAPGEWDKGGWFLA